MTTILVDVAGITHPVQEITFVSDGVQVRNKLTGGKFVTGWGETLHVALVNFKVAMVEHMEQYAMIPRGEICPVCKSEDTQSNIEHIKCLRKKCRCLIRKDGAV